MNLCTDYFYTTVTSHIFICRIRYAMEVIGNVLETNINDFEFEQNGVGSYDRHAANRMLYEIMELLQATPIGCMVMIRSVCLSACSITNTRIKRNGDIDLCDARSSSQTTGTSGN